MLRDDLYFCPILAEIFESEMVYVLKDSLQSRLKGVDNFLLYTLENFKFIGTRQCCGSEIIFFGSGSDFSGNFGSGSDFGSDLIYQ